MWQLKKARILCDQDWRRDGNRPADHGKIFRATAWALLVNSMLFISIAWSSSRLLP